MTDANTIDGMSPGQGHPMQNNTGQGGEEAEGECLCFSKNTLIDEVPSYNFRHSICLDNHMHFAIDPVGILCYSSIMIGLACCLALVESASLHKQSFMKLYAQMNLKRCAESDIVRRWSSSSLKMQSKDCNFEHTPERK